MIAKAFGRRDDSKLRAVTILHTGNATEQVRLPPGVTVHPGVRSKLPLGKRVRAKVSGKKGGVVSAGAATTPTSGGGVPGASGGDGGRKKRRRRRKEVIDYSDKTKGPLVGPPAAATQAEDPLGKVRNWLISSNPAPEVPPKKVSPHMPKSKSTPAALQSPAAATPPAPTAVVLRPPPKSRSKSNSLGNLQSKSKLQLLYKPPFRLTVKLKKREDGRQAAAAVARGRTALLIGRSVHKRPVAKQTAREDPMDVTTTVPSDRAVLISGQAAA